MPEHLPSLSLLLELIQMERANQLAHFDALDNKASFVLAFSGLLITLAPDITPVLRGVGVAAAALAAALALWAFWPRRLPTLEPSGLRRYLRAEERFTRLTVHDSLEHLVNEASVVLEEKGRRLRGSLTATLIATGVFAVGTVVNSP